MVFDIRVASSGVCGGGLGAVVPAVGDDGPVFLLFALAATVVDDGADDGADVDDAVGLSPTTSISSSSSAVDAVVSTTAPSLRICHGYAFHFFAIRHRGIVRHRGH